MITKEKLKIYKHFNGDIDGWAHFRKHDNENIAMSDKDWGTIEGFIQDIRMSAKGLASESYLQNTYERLKDNCDNNETAEELKNMANFYH